MSNAHFRFLFLCRAGQVLPGGDLQVGVIALGQLHGAAGQLEQAAVVGDAPGLLGVQLPQRHQIGRAVKALGRLHRIQGAAVGRGLHKAGLRHGLAVTAHRRFDGILHRHGRGSGPAAGGSFQCRRDDRLAHEGPGRVVHRHDVPFCRQNAIFRALGAGGTAGHDLHGLCAVRSLLLHKRTVFARHQNDLRHQRALLKRTDAAAQHRLTAQIKAELIKAHPGGRPCRHQHRRYSLFHFLHLPYHTPPFSTFPAAG